MKLSITIAATLLHTMSTATPINEAGFPSARNQQKILAHRDCGKFVMDCEKAAGACNNACYHINCFDKKSKTMVYDGTDDNKKNRQESGCETADGAICNKLPFSQRLHDPLNSDLGDVSFNCDEWPMAATKQHDFTEGTVRNSLRCIPATENSSGGGQLAAFLQGTNNDGPQKTCEGPMVDGDHWIIEFNLDNTPDNQVPHCKKPNYCDGDPYQFHLTKKPNENGKLSFPSDKDKDNHYALGLSEPDLLQCHVVVKYDDSKFEATVYDVTNTKKGYESALKEDESLTVTGLPLDLAISNTKPVGFTYGAENDHMGFFKWKSNSKGVSDQLDNEGRYCTSDEKEIVCYFPCPGNSD